MSKQRTSQSEANKNKDKLSEKTDEKDKKSTEFGYDPSYQNQGIDPGKPSNPNVPTPKDLNQDNAKLHPMIGDDDRIRSSGRAIHGGPNPPLVSVHPTSGKLQERSEPEHMSGVLEDLLGDQTAGASIYGELEVGDGFFVAVEPNRTLDQTIFEAHKRVKQLNDYWSTPYLNDEGEEVSDQVIVHEFKRNEDKSIQLGDKSMPVTGANHTLIKRRIQIRQYAVKSVTANDKFSSDGALIVRVF